jgi:hypothetical protein
MLRALLLLCLLPFTLLPSVASACECQTSYGPCNEVGASDLVFTGTVESITPLFLSRWNLASRSVMQSLNEAYLEAQQHPTAENIARLKDIYLKNFPDSAADVQAAGTINAVTSAFYSTLNRGLRIHFRAGTVFKHDEDDEEEETYDIWTPFGDCGLDFQAGETYVVYANEDESSGLYSTTRCSRTRRVTDAGADLAYLFFYENDDEKAARIEGFATTDEHYQLDLSKMRDPQSVKAPVAGLVIELQSEALTRFTEADAKGHYVFDGLGEGDYKVTAFSAGYPKDPKPLGEPRQVHLRPGACGLQFLLIPKN